MIFLDRLEPEVDADIQNFDENQMNNYKLLNRILADSLNYNPSFVHFVACKYTVAKYHKYMQKYGGYRANEWLYNMLFSYYASLGVFSV